MSSRQPAEGRAPHIARGEIFWIEAAELACEPSAARHPHVVVQDDVLNRSRLDTVVVCALTSNLQRASEPGNVLLEVGEGGLPRRSVVVVSQVSSVKKAALGEYIGQLSVERIGQIFDGLRFQQVSFFGDR